MKIEVSAAYFVKAVLAPGKGPTRSTDTHFSVKAGFNMHLDGETGWLTVERHGDVRLVPPSNIVSLVPAGLPEEPRRTPAKASPAPPAPPAKVKSEPRPVLKA